MKVYGDHESGNCYKIRLLLSHLDRSYEWVEVDILARSDPHAGFSGKNPIGRVPLLQFEDGAFPRRVERHPAASRRGHRYLPAGKFERAKAL